MMIMNVIFINNGACGVVFRKFCLTVLLLTKAIKIILFCRYMNDISTLDNWRLLSCIRLINHFELWYGNDVSGFDILC